MKDENCIFCKIVAGEMPCHKIYEDSWFLAFLDINPRSPGHALVIPKDHHRWVWDLPSGGGQGSIGEYFEVSKKIALAQREAFNTQAIWVRVTGDEVPHAHIWVLPETEIPGDKNDLAGNAEKICKFIN